MSIEVSTRYDAGQLAELVQRNARLAFRNNSRRFRLVRFREEGAIYSGVGDWRVLRGSVPDPAAVMGMVISLDARASASDFKGNVSEAYKGADNFMRSCMAAAEFFEAWADEHVDFECLDEVWPYLLQEKFGEAAHSELGLLALESIDAPACERIARKLGLDLKQSTKESQP